MSTTVKNLYDGSVIFQRELTEEDISCPEIQGGAVQLSFPEGEMNMKGWHFDGIRMGYSDLVLNKMIATEWKNDLDVVHLHFNLGGKIHVEMKDTRNILTLDRLQHNMSYQNGFDGIIRYDELGCKVFMIQFTKEAFIRLTENSSDKLMRFGEKILKGGPVQLSDQNSFIDASMHSAIDSVLNSNYTGGIRRMFFLSKCIEILVLQSEAFDRSEQKQFIYCKTQYDRERILFAREYMIQHFDVPPTLTELARIVGINEFKLKKGFKEVFNNTVFGYLTDYKMELARNELAQGQKTASELAYDLGYSSVQHFSNAFKKKFGMSPTKNR